MKLSQLLESKEVSTIVAHPINKLTKHKLERFQELASVIRDKVLLDTDQKINYENVLELKDELSPFSEFPFVANALKQLDGLESEYLSGEAAKSRLNATDAKSKKKSALADLEDAFLSLDIDRIESINDLLSDLLSGSDKINIDIDKPTKDIMKYAFTQQSMAFFSNGSDSVLSNFGAAEYKKIADIDLDKKYFTYVDFPRVMFNSPEYIIGFMLNLTDGPNPKRINTLGSMRRHSLQKHANSDTYKRLMHMVDRYLTNNDRDLIPEIMAELRKFPELERLNEKYKRKITTVYRGIPGPDLHQREIIDQERKSKYVATSTSYQAALNFAKAKGHLDANANAEGGWLLTYEVDPKSILLVTEILGTRYGESEILIDATKAQLEDIELLDFTEETEKTNDSSHDEWDY